MLQVNAFLATLPVMGKGMGGIFVVTVVIILSIGLLNMLTAKRKTKQTPREKA